ncbi:MAG: envelope stress response membrane protein PspB [Novosphingobium sp.]|uniref:envelope stress response membrane protein PspB n=1 Tax=Novosphingobium sp. TaxID=1874826 RepID=UPI0032BB2CE7
MDFPSELVVIPAIFLGLPWIVLHYITKWKTAATLTNDDESLLEELYQVARRLDDRMDTVERLVASDNPDFQPPRVLTDRAIDDEQLSELDQIRSLGRSKATTGRNAK